MKLNNIKNTGYSAVIAILSVVIFLPAMISAGTIQLPKTGQTYCYDAAGNEISCAGTGQDWKIQAGVAWPSPRFSDHANGTVSDNLTGLMWTKDGNLPGSYKTWYQAMDYVAGMNAGSYQNFGYTDWRLPNVNELESLTNAQTNAVTWLNSNGFTNVQSTAAMYWSSTTNASSTDSAWYVVIWSGYVGNELTKSYYNYVWPVRAGQSGAVDLTYPANIWKSGQTTNYYSRDDGYLETGVAWPSPRFQDNGDGTVTDNLTGLMWTKNANLPGGYITWNQALNYVTSMNNGSGTYGYTDWRLPNRKELRSLVDYSQYNPALPPMHPFTDVQTISYWSSTTNASSTNISGYAWMIDMGVGRVHCDYDKSHYYSVWPVRDGLTTTLITLSSFTATPKADKVILQWSTESEIDNAGFNLYRSESENGEYIKITTALIPAKGSSTEGASYEFTDDNVKNRKTYYYKLEDIDLSGKSTMHGPMSATPRLICGIFSK